MAESVSFIHFAAATKSPLSKPKEPKATPENRAQSSRDHHPPPPKKVRNDEKSLKPKKLNGEGGGGGSGEKQHPKPSYGSPTTWSFGPIKSSNPTAPAQPPLHKVFKQSAFLASPPKPKKPREKREKEKEKEKKKHKLAAENTASSLLGSGLKKENGEVKLVQKGKANVRGLATELVSLAVRLNLFTRNLLTLAAGCQQTKLQLVCLLSRCMFATAVGHAGELSSRPALKCA